MNITSKNVPHVFNEVELRSVSGVSLWPPAEETTTTSVVCGPALSSVYTGRLLKGCVLGCR